MKVKLLAHTPEPEKVISMAAKLCYSPVGVDEIAENLTQESINKFLNMLVWDMNLQLSMLHLLSELKEYQEVVLTK